MKLTTAEQRIVDWMRDGDRALQSPLYDRARYGFYKGGKFVKIATRKQVESLIKKGMVEWYACSPPDLRAMLIENRPKNEGPNGQSLESIED